MQLRIRRKLFAALLATAAFGLSIGVMYILWARFEPTYFFIASGAYAVLLFLALLLVGRKPKDLEDEIERDLEDHSARPDQVSAGTGLRAPVAVLDEGPDGLPLQVEKATGMAPLEPGETTGAAEPAPRPYAMRGFTLYERATKKGTQRFFAKGKPVGGGQPIPLPEGFEAKWDTKKKRPYLEEIPAAEPVEPTPPPEEEFEVSKAQAKMPTGITASRRDTAEEAAAPASRARPCAAFLSPGIMCTRDAKGDTPYCSTHAKYKPDSVMTGFEARHDTAGSQHKPFRGAVGEFEVHVAKPSAKPLRFKAPTVEVQTARPSTHPAPTPKGSRAKPPKPIKTPAKPIKGLMDRPFEVRLAKPSVKPLRVTGPGLVQGQVSRPAAPKPLKLRATDSFVVKTTKPLVKPVTVRPGREPVVRPSASLADAKPLKVRQPSEPLVRPGASLADAKPLKLRKSVEPVVRSSASLADTKPLVARAAKEPVVRSSPSLANVKPLRFGATNDFDVNTARGTLVSPPKRARRCMATLRNGNRCSNDARPGTTLCAQHKDFTPRIEAVVVRDTRSRTNQGVGDQDRRKKR